MKKRKKTGFTMIETMIALGLGSIVVLSTYKLLDNLNKSNADASVSFQANQIRRDVVAVLQNSAGWHNTLWGSTNATTFACLINYTDCNLQVPNPVYNGPNTSSNTQANYFSSSVTGAFDVYTPTSSISDSASSIYYQSSSATAGFRLNGSQCSTWAGTPFVSGGGTNEKGAANTLNNCAFRLVLWWVPICPNTTGMCISPTVHIMGYMLYTPSAGDATHSVAFNPGNYGVNFVVSPVPH